MSYLLPRRAALTKAPSIGPDGPPIASRGPVVLATVLVGTVLGALNNSVANVAVLDVLTEFGLDVGAGSWFVSGYVLAFAALLPVAGWVAGRLGTRTTYLGSVGLLAVASATVAAAPSYPVVIAARLVQGAAAAPILPVVMMTVVATFAPDRRGRAMGVWASANGLAIALGPAVGGVLAHGWGWRSIFWLDVPLAVIAFALAARVLPEVSRRTGPALDVPSAVLLVGGLAAGLGAIATAGAAATGPLVPCALVAAGATALRAFWRRCVQVAPERDAVIAPGVLRDRTFVVLCALAAIQMSVLSSVLLTTPLLLAGEFDRDLDEVGVLTFVLPLSMIVAAPAFGARTSRIGARRLVQAGGLLLAGGSVCLGVGAALHSLPVVVAGLVVAGGGVAAIQSPTAIAAAERVGEADRGPSAGLFHASRFAGAVIGASLAAGVIASVGSGSAPFVAAFGVAALLSVVAAVTTRVLRVR